MLASFQIGNDSIVASPASRLHEVLLKDVALRVAGAQFLEHRPQWQ